jgi:hypothetical protein
LEISETHERPFEEMVALGAMARAGCGGVSVIGVRSALQLFLSGSRQPGQVGEAAQSSENTPLPHSLKPSNFEVSQWKNPAGEVTG